MIERIIIENFKSIRKLDLELKPINILVGANGAGKSNLLSFFELTNNATAGLLKEYIGNSIDRLLRFGRKESVYLFGLFEFGNKCAFSYKIVPAASGNSGYIDEEKILQNQSDEKEYQNWKTLGQREKGGVFDLPSSLNTEILMNSTVRPYFKSFKKYHFQDVSSTALIKRTNKINDNRFLRENGENLAAYLYYLQEKHSQDFKNIENQIRSVAPFFDKFDLQPDKLKEDQIELRWIEKGSDDYFNAYDLSDGTLRFMALTTLLLQPDLPKTIIIDEPELGLHPFAINKLAAMMKQAAANGSQVIVSTQSVNLVDNFEPEDVIAVDREDDQSVFRRLNSEDLKEWLEDYTLGDLWNKNVIGARP